MLRRSFALSVVLLVAACSDKHECLDAMHPDAAHVDAGRPDASVPDAAVCVEHAMCASNVECYGGQCVFAGFGCHCP